MDEIAPESGSQDNAPRKYVPPSLRKKMEGGGGDEAADVSRKMGQVDLQGSDNDANGERKTAPYRPPIKDAGPAQGGGMVPLAADRRQPGYIPQTSPVPIRSPGAPKDWRHGGQKEGGVTAEGQWRHGGGRDGDRDRKEGESPGGQGGWRQGGGGGGMGVGKGATPGSLGIKRDDKPGMPGKESVSPDQWRSNAAPISAKTETDWRQGARVGPPPAPQAPVVLSREEEISALRGLRTKGGAEMAVAADVPPQRVPVKALADDDEIENFIFRPAKAKK